MNRAAVFLAAVMTLIGTFYAARYFDELVTHENTLPVIETLGGDFALPATSGGTVSLQQFRGRVVLLNFGFTSCPDVCPTVLARMRRLLLGLGDAISDVQPLFVTIDPARDTLDVLKPYLEHFHPAFIGLGGSEQQIRAAADLFKVYYARDDATGASYGFTHSDRIYLIDRQGRVRATFANSTTDDEMLAAVRLLLTE